MPGIAKHKGHRSSKNKGYYERQKMRTEINKSRRRLKAAAKKKFWHEKRELEAAIANTNPS